MLQITPRPWTILDVSYCVVQSSTRKNHNKAITDIYYLQLKVIFVSLNSKLAVREH